MKKTLLLLMLTMSTGCASCLDSLDFDQSEMADDDGLEFEEDPEIVPPEEPEPREFPEDERHSVCDYDDPPQRCVENPVAGWGEAVVLHELILDATETEAKCCADIDGDGELDNAFGVADAGLTQDPPRFETQTDRMATGKDAVVLELITDGEAARVQWWPARWAPNVEELTEEGNDVYVQSYAVDEGRQSRYGFGEGMVEDGTLTAAGGVIEIPIVLFGVPLRVEAAVADVEAEFYETSDGLEVRGEVASYTDVRQIYTAVNRAAESCSCLGIEEPLIDDEGTCSEIDRYGCDHASTACRQLADSCSGFAVAEVFADLDLDGDGVNESISAGYYFEGYPATIVGTAE